MASRALLPLDWLWAACDQSFDEISANEWRVTNAPYIHGNIGFTADPATETEAQLLETVAGALVFVIARTTWDGGQTVTTTRLTYAPGYCINTRIGASALAD